MSLVNLEVFAQQLQEQEGVELQHQMTQQKQNIAAHAGNR